MSSISTDTFNRANQTGWGTASGGGTWTFNGAAQNTIASIASNEGKCTASTTLTTATLGGTAQDGMVQARVSADHVGDHVGLIARATGTTTYYRAEINGGNSMSLSKVVSGTSTDLATGTISYATTDKVWIRLLIIGSNLYCNFWKDGTAEPGTWTLTATDSSIVGAGNWGVKIKLSAVGDVITFDNFAANTAQVQTTQTRGKYNTKFPSLGSIIRSNFSTKFPRMESNASSCWLTQLTGVSITSSSTVTKYVPRTFGSLLTLQYSYVTYTPHSGGPCVQGRARFSTSFAYTYQLVEEGWARFIISRSPQAPDTFSTFCDGIDTFVQLLG